MDAAPAIQTLAGKEATANDDELFWKKAAVEEVHWASRVEYLAEISDQEFLVERFVVEQDRRVRAAILPRLTKLPCRMRAIVQSRTMNREVLALIMSLPNDGARAAVAKHAKNDIVRREAFSRIDVIEIRVEVLHVWYDGRLIPPPLRQRLRQAGGRR